MTDVEVSNRNAITQRKNSFWRPSLAIARRPNVRNVNLNLFPILRELLRFRNVTQAAHELHLTQSAVSGALRRLRDQFGDDLLVQRGREMELTEKARALLPMLDRLNDAAEQLIGRPEFDPASIQDVYSIGGADWISMLLVPALYPKLQKYAPGLSVQFIHGGRHEARELKQHGLKYLLLGPEQVGDWTGLNLQSDDSEFETEVCFSDRLIGVAPNDQDIQALTDNLEAYLRHPHLTFNYGRGIHGSTERETLNELGLSQNDRILMPEFLTMPYLVVATGAIALMPLSVARRTASCFAVKLFEPPVKHAPFNLVMVWAKSRQDDSGLRWLRKIIRNSFAEVAAADAAAPAPHIVMPSVPVMA